MNLYFEWRCLRWNRHEDCCCQDSSRRRCSHNCRACDGLPWNGDDESVELCCLGTYLWLVKDFENVGDSLAGFGTVDNRGAGDMREKASGEEEC